MKTTAEQRKKIREKVSEFTDKKINVEVYIHHPQTDIIVRHISPFNLNYTFRKKLNELNEANIDYVNLYRNQYGKFKKEINAFNTAFIEDFYNDDGELSFVNNNNKVIRIRDKDTTDMTYDVNSGKMLRHSGKIGEAKFRNLHNTKIVKSNNDKTITQYNGDEIIKIVDFNNDGKVIVNDKRDVGFRFEYEYEGDNVSEEKFYNRDILERVTKYQFDDKDRIIKTEFKYYDTYEKEDSEEPNSCTIEWDDENNIVTKTIYTDIGIKKIIECDGKIVFDDYYGNITYYEYYLNTTGELLESFNGEYIHNSIIIKKYINKCGILVNTISSRNSGYTSTVSDDKNRLLYEIRDTTKIGGSIVNVYLHIYPEKLNHTAMEVILAYDDLLLDMKSFNINLLNDYDIKITNIKNNKSTTIDNYCDIIEREDCSINMSKINLDNKYISYKDDKLCFYVDLK